MGESSLDAAAETVPLAGAKGRTTAPETGRYELLDRLGEGAMGVVWEAHDRVLDRRVALKLLHDQFLGAADQERLADEARAMARLSHPNVVAVYDVGEREGRTFLTMELVRGEPVSRWLETPRGWREVLEVFRAAGEGLAAAHGAGIVHRDVKPSNILLGADGRVRVADFGVAHASSVLAGTDVPTAASVTAGFVGTPLYMSPERLAGQPADALGDQFAFCVALYEALNGKRPFRSETVDELRAAIEAGPPPPSRDVPRWLADVVARGLAADPSARFPSMRELLAALRRRHGRAWWGLAIGGAGAAAIAASLVLGRGSAGPTCTTGAARVGEVWNPYRSVRLVATLAAQPVEYAAPTARETARLLDDYAADLAAMYDDACEATHVDHAQSVAMLERRRLCLDERRGDLGRVIDQLLHDGSLVEKATRLAHGLEPIADCAAPEYLDGLASAPPAPSVADDLALARVSLLSGRYEAGQPAAERVVAAAKLRGDRRLELDAMILLGRLQGYTKQRARGIETLRAAAELAAAQNVPRARAEALIYLSATLQMMGRLDVAGDVLDTADGLLAKLSDPLLAAHAESVRGTLLGRRTRYADAVPHFERALAGFTAIYGADSEALSPSLSNLALALRRSGHPEAALAHLRRARELTAALGEMHPSAIKARRAYAVALDATGHLADAEQELRAVLALEQRLHREPNLDVAAAWSDLGVLYSNLGKLEDALEAFEGATAIRMQVAPDARQTLMERANIADTLTQLGRAKEAEPIIREVLAARTRLLGPVHGDVALGHRQLGSALYELGRPAEAAREYAAARAIYVELHGEDNPDVAATMRDHAAGERGRRRFATALELDKKALAISEHALVAGSPARVHSLVAIAADLEGLGRPKPAVEYAERAVSESRAADFYSADARWILARLLVATHGDDARAASLAADARARFAALPHGLAKARIAEIDAWLAERGAPEANAR